MPKNQKIWKNQKLNRKIISKTMTRIQNTGKRKITFICRHHTFAEVFE